MSGDCDGLVKVFKSSNHPDTSIGLSTKPEQDAITLVVRNSQTVHSTSIKFTTHLRGLREGQGCQSTWPGLIKRGPPPPNIKQFFVQKKNTKKFEKINGSDQWFSTFFVPRTTQRFYIAIAYHQVIEIFNLLTIYC